MKLEARTYQHGGRWFFDLVDTDDTLTVRVGGQPQDLPELIHSDTRPAASEKTAAKRGRQWIAKQGAGQ